MQQRGCIGQDNALCRTVAHVAFMPERLVLHCNGGVSAQESRKSCDPFALHRVALLWHSGAPRLTGAEGLTQLIDLTVL